MSVFPIKFDQCPVCGSQRRIIEEEIQQEVDAGRLPEGSKTGAMVTQTALFNPRAATTGILAKREVSLLVGLYDCCSSCGCFYLVDMRKQTTIVSPQVNKPPEGNDGGNPWKIN